MVEAIEEGADEAIVIERADMDEPLDEWPEPDVVRAHLDELAARAAQAGRRDHDLDNPVVDAAPSVVDDEAESGEAVVDGEPVGSPFPRSRPFDLDDTWSPRDHIGRQPPPSIARTSATAAGPAQATGRAIHKAACNAGDEMWRPPQRGAGALSALEAALRIAFAASPGQLVAGAAPSGGSSNGAAQHTTDEVATDSLSAKSDLTDDLDGLGTGAGAGAPVDAGADVSNEPVQTLADSAAPDSNSDVSIPYAGKMAIGPMGWDLGDGGTAGTVAGVAVGATSEPSTPTGATEATSSDIAIELADHAPVVSGGGWSTPAALASRSLEQWSVLALVAAGIGLLPITWPVPILSLMAVAFGLVGMRNCQLDRMWRNRWMAVLAFGLGLATLVAALLLTSLGKLHFLPFWTTSQN